jgi:Tol biopolymer transport system component
MIGATVYAVAFDLKKLQVTGGPVPVLEGVRRAVQPGTAAAFLSFSDDGSLIWIPGVGDGGTPLVLALVDRSGSRKVLSLSPAGYDVPRISPDGKHLAVGIRDSKDFNIWIYDLDGNRSIRRLTFGGQNQNPTWTPDSKRIAFRSDRDGEGIYWQAADGSGAAERLIATDKGDASDAPMEWSPDGKTLVFFVTPGDRRLSGVLTLGLDGDRKPQPLFTSTSKNMRRTSFSPDGRWIAYSSNEEGDFSVYVQPFPPTGAKYKISTKEAADSPLWTPDGKQIVFASGSRLMSVDVQTTPSLAFSEPKGLPIEIENTQGRPYDITRDGKQFLVMQRPDQSATAENTSPQINVVLNWFREFQERVLVK